VLAAVLLTLGIPGLRRSLRWRLPGFKEAALGQFASAMGLMLKRGCHLSDALNLAADLEKETHLGQELAAWKSRLAGGLGKFAEFASPSRIFPPLFIWLVGKAGEDLAGGFNRAAEIYYARAMNRVDMLLYAFLPVAVLVLGVMILGQLFPFLRTIAGFLDMIGSVGD
jgi:type II secretory pathway component PulF